MIEIIPRSEWTSRVVSLPSISRPVPNCIIHWTGSCLPDGASEATEAAHLRGVESYHVNSRGYSAVGYSFLVCPSGRVYEGRGWAKYGAHTGNNNGNRVGHGISVVDCSGDVPDVVLDSIRQLIAEGQRLGHVSKDVKVTGHRDWGSYFGGGTSCPGDYLYSQLPTLARPIEEDDMALFKDRADFQREIRKALGGHVDGEPKLTQDEIKAGIEFAAGQSLAMTGGGRPTESGPKQAGFDFAKKLIA